MIDTTTPARARAGAVYAGETYQLVGLLRESPNKSKHWTDLVGHFIQAYFGPTMRC